MKKLLCVALILSLVVCLAACGGSGYKSLVGDYVEAMNDCDAEKMLDALPKEYIDYMEDQGIDEDDLIDELEYYLELMFEELEDEYGDDIKITYKITENKKMDKDDLEDLQDEYDEMDYDIDIEEARELEVELTIKGDDDKDTDDLDLIIIKVDGEWYMGLDNVLF